MCRRRMKHPVVALLALASLVIVLPEEVSADASPWSERVGVDVTLGTAFPLDLGVRAQLALPHGLALRLGVGWMPPAYVDSINTFCVGVAWYDQVTADLITAALENAAVLDAGIAYQPFEHEGFEVSASFIGAALGGGLGATEAIEAVTGRMVDRSRGATVPLSATAVGFRVGVGWRFVIETHWLVVVSLSYLQLVASEVWIAGDRSSGATQAASAALDAYLESYITTYVKTPLLGVEVGYRF